MIFTHGSGCCLKLGVWPKPRVECVLYVESVEYVCFGKGWFYRCSMMSMSTHYWVGGCVRWVLNSSLVDEYLNSRMNSWWDWGFWGRLSTEQQQQQQKVRPRLCDGSHHGILFPPPRFWDKFHATSALRGLGRFQRMHKEVMSMLKLFMRETGNIMMMSPLCVRHAKRTHIHTHYVLYTLVFDFILIKLWILRI